MRLASLRLADFRNYHALEITFGDGLNLLVGENAQGKSNLLEAVYLLATGRSYRGAGDSDLIRWGAEGFAVRGEVFRGDGEVTLEVACHAERRKRIRINETDVRRLSELFGFLTAVIFSPEDLQLVKGGPAHRRRFLDLELAQIDPAYRRDLIDYQQVLEQRNNLLKQGLIRSSRVQPGDGELAAWDDQLVSIGARVQGKRARAVAALSRLAGEAHSQVTAGREELRLSYLAACGPGATRIEIREPGEWTAERFRERLTSELAEIGPAERRRGMTLLGPHRDDLSLAVNGTDARAYGSQGQQRTAALALKLGEIEYMRQATGEYPVLLLDDVMSELDEGRRRFLLSVAGGKTQVFVTATTTRSLPEEHVAAATLFMVQQGRIVSGGELLSEARPEESGAQ